MKAKNLLMMKKTKNGKQVNKWRIDKNGADGWSHILTKTHTDGAWPGSKIVDNQLVHDAFGDRLSQMSFLLFLSDNYTGGRTLFFTGPNFNEVVCVSTPKGAALCFPHGFHPKQYLHAGETIESGMKMIIRSDILFTMRN